MPETDKRPTASPVNRWDLFDPSFYQKRFKWIMGAIFFAGSLLLLASSLTGDSHELIVGDGREYFEYARTLMIEGHLPEKRVLYPCGVSMIGLLGYAPSIWLARWGDWLQSPAATRGWGVLNQYAFCLPLIGLALLGMLANLRTLERLGFDPGVARFSLLVWFVGTNVPYYIFKEPAMSESATYSTLSIYYYYLIHDVWKSDASDPTSDKPLRIGAWLPLGLALGLAGAVRQQNILHSLALPILVAVELGRIWRTDPLRALRRWSRTVIPVAVVSALVFSIPYMAWMASRASMKVYSYGDQGFNFLRPHLFAVLFSPKANGLLIWTPVFLVAALGLAPFIKRYRRLATALLPVALAQYYLIASWWAHSFGTSVGHRGFFTILPIMLLGLPALLETAGKHRRKLMALLVLLSAANVGVMFLISLGINPF